MASTDLTATVQWAMKATDVRARRICATIIHVNMALCANQALLHTIAIVNQATQEEIVRQILMIAIQTLVCMAIAWTISEVTSASVMWRTRGLTAHWR